MQKTIILKEDRYLDHVTQPGHPECSERLRAIYARLKDEDVKDCFEEVQPEQVSIAEISMNHSSEYIETIKATDGRSFVSLDPDTTTSSGSWKASILAAGAVITGIDMIMDGKADNGFALVRPPGHHAEKSRAMGFCLFNNIAIGAKHLLKNHHLKRILIIDWDIHHGNGTQNSFYSSPEVLYFSTHQYPYFPGTGAFNETGIEDGAGFNVNVPLGGGQGDGDFLKIFSELLLPIAEQYRPEFILVSAGYDIYRHDPLGTMDVTPEGFFSMALFLKQMARKLCNGKILMTLEGGYNIEGIAESVMQTVKALSEEGCVSPAVACSSGKETDTIVDKARQVHSAYWPVLK